MNLKDKKVTVMGLGLLGGGLGATKWLANQGAEVLVTDLKDRKELKPSLKKLEDFNLEYVLGEHRPQDFEDVDMVVKNPAVKDDSKFLKIAQKNNIPIETEISLFFKNSPCPIIGITGTKGKSTVATLTHKLLNEKYQTILGGNIKTKTLPKLKALNENSLAILELSSWQLSSLEEDQLSPRSAIVTNIKKDHLNRYDSFKSYVADKSTIHKFQEENDYLILNRQDPVSSKFGEDAAAQVYYYNYQKQLNQNRGATVKNDSIVFNGEEICKKDLIKIPGEHNLINTLAAVTMAKIYEVENKTIKKVLSNFKGLPHRLELIKEGKVDFYNDTCATNPAAAKAAIESFDEDEKIVLIAGGAEKDLNFEELAETIANRVKAVILLKGDATPRLKEKVKEALQKQNKRIPINKTKSMEKAVRAATKLAEPKKEEPPSESANISRPGHGIVLLSPACASFGQFINEFDRGNKFKEAVENQ